MGVFMLMFSLLVRVTPQIPMILSMSHCLRLEGPIVSISVFTATWTVCHGKPTLLCIFSAVVAFLPKSKSDKKRSLLGSSKEFGGEESVDEVLFISQFHYNLSFVCEKFSIFLLFQTWNIFFSAILVFLFVFVILACFILLKSKIIFKILFSFLLISALIPEVVCGFTEDGW